MTSFAPFSSCKAVCMVRRWHRLALAKVDLECALAQGLRDSQRKMLRTATGKLRRHCLDRAMQAAEVRITTKTFKSATMLAKTAQ